MSQVMYRVTPGWPGQGAGPHSLSSTGRNWGQAGHLHGPHVQLAAPRRPVDGPNDLIVRKVCGNGVGYSVVELNDVRHVFAAAVPRSGHTLRDQARDALRTIEALMHEESTRGSIVHQAVFVSDPAHLEEIRQIIRTFYGPEQLPATSYIFQKPCEGKLLSIEALGVGQGEGAVEIERRSEQLVIARHNGIAWVHTGHVVPQRGESVYDRTLDAFCRMRQLLAEAGVRFDQVIRTWLYLGGIVDDDGPTQRYKELNRARSDFFQDVRFLSDRLPPGQDTTVYPASTGIGTDNRDVVMSCIALATDRKDILAMPLENPRQVAAFDYASRYSPKSPKFSRAMALSCGQYATIMISGTASITQSETRHLGNVARQTHETLDNIEALISEENLAAHGLPGLGTSLRNLGLLRVYIKRQEDYVKTRSVCESRLGELPTIYAVADVCRPDLLVEIEGVAFSRRKA